MEENAIIQPEEDYEAWCFIFQTAVQPDGDSFTALVPSYINMINSIITTNQLPDPISDFTNDFIDKFVPDIVNKVLNLGYVNQNEVEMIGSFLISTSDLIPWAASHEKYFLIKLIFPVISGETEDDSKTRSTNDLPKPNYNYYNRSFYSMHSKTYKSVLQHYFDSCIPLLVKQCIEPASSFYIYNLIFYLVSDNCINEIPINENIVKPAIESFIKFLRNIDVHNISDISDLQKCIQNYTLFVILYFKPLIPQLIQLSEEFIKSGILDKQFFGIDTITRISERSEPEILEYFSLWASKTDLTDYILSKSFNNSFYERIRPIMVKLMSKELLEKFWNNALIAHKSQRKPMFEILSKAIVSIDEQSAIEFINYVILTASSPHPLKSSSSTSSTLSSTSLLTPLSSSESILSCVSSSDIFSSSSSQNLIGSKLDIDIFQFLANVARSFATSNQKLTEYVTDAIFRLGLMPSNRKIACECLISLCKLPQVQEKLFTLCCEQLSNFDIIEFNCKVLEVLIETSYNLPLSRLKAAILRIVSKSNRNQNKEKNQEQNKEKNQEKNKDENQEQNEDENQIEKQNNVQNENKTDNENNNNDVVVDDSKQNETNNNDNNDGDDLDPQVFLTYKILLCNLFYKTLKKSRSPITKRVVDAFSKTGIDDSLFSMLLMNLKTLGTDAFGNDVNQILFDDIISHYDFEKSTETFSDFFVYFILKINIENGNIETYGKNPKVINLNSNKFTITKIPLDHIDLLIKLYCEIESEGNLTFLMRQILQIFTQVSISTDKMMEYFIQLIDPYVTEINQRSTYRVLMLIKNLLLMEKFYYIELFGRSRHIPTNFDNHFDINIKVKHGMNNNINLTIKALPIAPLRSIQEQIGFLLSLAPKFISLYKNDAYLNPGSTLNELKIKNGDNLVANIIQDVQFEFTFPSIILTNLHFQNKLLKIINNNDYEKVTNLSCDILNTLPDATSLSSVTIDDIKNSQSGYSFLYKLQIYTKNAKKLDSKNTEFFLDLMITDKDNNPYHILSINEATIRTISCEALKFVNDKFDAEFLCNSFDRIIMFCLNILCIINLDMSSYDNNQRNSISLMNKIIKVDSSIVTQISLKNIDLVEKVMLSNFYDQDNLMLLINLFDKFEDLRPIFDICISHLNQQGSSDNFVKIFSHIVSNVVDFVNLDDVFTKCLNSLNSNSNPHLFCEICKAIEALIKTDSSLAKKYGSELVTKLITIAFENDNINIHTSAFSISEIVCQLSKEAMQTIIKLLKPHFEQDYDFYSFKPSNNTRSPLNYSGLRNLGSTCYMNSIFQQLFYVPPFRYRILTEDFTQYDKNKVNKEINNDGDDDGNKAIDSYYDENIEAHIKFQYLFSEMLLTKRKACDTQPFCSCWKGWAKQLINPREQQDAFEFLQIFIDQFPSSINKYFRGTIKNTIKGENFETSNLEQFYTFCLTIQNCANITDAFKNFLQSETFPQYKTDDGRVIDAQKSARINEAPPVLVLQLKRFEYDLRTWERIKINDRCEFDYTLNIRDFMENTNEDVVYQLTGVVLHAGTAMGGHYTSVVNLNRRWVYFNDQEVSIINNSEFQKIAFGGNSKNNEFDAEPCAFLLFYTRTHSEWNGISFFEDQAQKQDFRRFLTNNENNNDTIVNMNDLIKPEIKEKIMKDNAEVIGLQCTFSQQLFSFVMTINDPFLLISYFINIFCHSGIDMGIKAQKTIETSINDLNEIQLNEVFQYLVANNDKIDKILSQCTLNDITDSLTNVIYSCYKKLKPQQTIEYIEHFFNVMQSVARNWRQIPQFARIIYDFVLIGNEHAQIAIERNWTMKLIHFLNLIYEGQKSSVLLNNIDLSDIFLTLQVLMENICITENDEEISQESKIAIEELKVVISQYNGQILSSPSNLNSFVSLISLLGDRINIDMSHILTVLSTKEIDDTVFNDIFSSTIEKIKTAEQAKNIIRCLSNLKGPKIWARLVVSHICKLINENNETIRQFFLRYPNETLISMCFDNEYTMRQASEGICSVLFSNFVKPLPDLKSYLPYNAQIIAQKKNESKKIKDLNYDPHEEYKFNNEKAKEEMSNLYESFLSHLDEFVIDNAESFYSKENNYSALTENCYKLVSFLKIFRWFLLCLHNENDLLLSALMLLFQDCVRMDYQLDYHLINLCDIFSLFDSSDLNQIAASILKDMFRFIADLQPYQAKLLTIHYWNIARKVSNEVFIDLLKEELFAIAIQQLLCSYTSEKTAIMNEFSDKIFFILSSDSNDPQSQERKMILKSFIITVLDIEFLQKMVEYSLDIVFPLLNIVIDDVQSNVVLSFLIHLISLIVKDSHSITYEPTRTKTMERLNIMFYFVNYINNSNDFKFSALTIKYNQLIDFIISCANACRSPYEHDINKESASNTRLYKTIDKNFLHYYSIECLSPTAKLLIGLKEEDAIKPREASEQETTNETASSKTETKNETKSNEQEETKSETKSNEQEETTNETKSNEQETKSETKSNENEIVSQKVDDASLAAVVIEEEEYNDGGEDEESPFLLKIEGSENNRRSKKPAPPISEITMDFIYLVAFFSMKYPPFFDSIMKFFSDTIVKKKKKKGRSSSLFQAIRAWAFLCLHTTRIEIAAERCKTCDMKEINKAIQNHFTKFGQNLTIVLTFARSCSQKAVSIFHDFISAQIIELRYKLGITDINDFDLNLTNNDDELMLAFFLSFVKDQTVKKFRVELFTSPSITEFYGSGLELLDADNIKNIFEMLVSSIGNLNSGVDQSPILQKIWLIMRRRPDMLSVLRDIFLEKNAERGEDKEIKRDFLESKSMCGLANLIFGKTKEEDNDNENIINNSEEEDRIENNGADIFENYKNDTYNESDEEYESDLFRSPYHYINDINDDSSEDDEPDFDYRRQRSLMEDVGFIERDSSRTK